MWLEDTYAWFILLIIAWCWKCSFGFVLSQNMLRRCFVEFLIFHFRNDVFHFNAVPVGHTIYLHGNPFNGNRLQTIILHGNIAGNPFVEFSLCLHCLPFFLASHDYGQGSYITLLRICWLQYWSKLDLTTLMFFNQCIFDNS